MRTLSLSRLIAAFLCGVTALLPSVGASAQNGPAKTNRITVSAERITLYNLVHKIARQSGFSLDVDPADPLSATPLTAYLIEIRPETVAAALASLLFAKRAVWRWERLSDKPGDGPGVSPADFKPGVAYRLRSSSGAKNYAAKARGRILQDLTGIISSAGAEGKAESGEIAAITKAYQRTAGEASDMTTAEGLRKLQAEYAVQLELRRRIAAVALTQLTPAMRERLTGQQKVRLPAESLNGAVAALIQEAAEAKGKGETHSFGGANGQILVNPPPSQPPTYALNFAVARDPFDVAPTLTVSIERNLVWKPDGWFLGGGSSSNSAIDTVGSVAEPRWRRVLTKEWTPDNDETPIPALQDTLALTELANRPLIKTFERTSDEDEDYHLRQTSESWSGPLTRLVAAVRKQKKRLNVLARVGLFSGSASDPFADEGAKTLGAARAALLKERAMPTRWFGTASEGVLLANALPAIWTAGPEKLVAPQTRTDFDALRRVDPNGFLALEQLCGLTRRYNRDILFALLSEKAEDDEEKNPSAPPPLPTQPSLAEFARDAYPLLNFLARNPGFLSRIQTEDEVRLDNPANSALKEAVLSLEPYYVSTLTDIDKNLPDDERPAAYANLRLRLRNEDKGSDAPAAKTDVTKTKSVRVFRFLMQREGAAFYTEPEILQRGL